MDAFALPAERGRDSDRRRRFVVVLLFAGGVALALRLIQLQVFERTRLAERANRQRSYVETLPASVGDLLDRHGRVLATAVPVRSLYVVPRNISDPRAVASKLAESLGLDADRLYSHLVGQRDKRFLWIKRRLTPDQEDAVTKLKLPAGSWGLRDEFVRRYPQGVLAVHVLGLRDVDGKGRGGLEEALDAVLRGRDGRRTLIRDARGRVIEMIDETDAPPRRGADVTTTIDSVVQVYAERQLDRLVARWKPKGACAVVEDPRTGEILAMASRPVFDPNNPERISDEAWKNRVISWMYEPGSTFKPFVVAAALENGVLKRDDTIDCGDGQARIGNRLLHDTHPHGSLCVADVLVKSSNIGMSRIGGRLSNDRLLAAIASFGFGRATGSGLPAEMAGLVRPVREWTSYSNASLSMGQELAVTPLQLISAHSSLANGGTAISPKLVLGISADLTNDAAQAVVRSSVIGRATDHAAARWLVEGPLTEVVRRGTGEGAQIAGYTVFGKTGTAQKIDPETRTYSETKYVSSFVCGAPACDPRAVVLVVVDEPSEPGAHYGGIVAAPAAAEILRQVLLHLHVSPDAAPHDRTASLNRLP